MKTLSPSAAAPIADVSRQDQRWIALLGRKDEPTDALEDYCKLLARPLLEKGCSLEISRIPWNEQGWRHALSDLENKFANQRGSWVLVQYTALAWSRRGFPVLFACIIGRLKRAGMRILIVFHDPEPFGGRRCRDRLRRRVQLAVMRRAARLADRIVCTISSERVSWMQEPAIHEKTRSVPGGCNLPVMARNTQATGQRIPVVVVFGFS